MLHSRSLTSVITPSGREFSPVPAARNSKPPVSSSKRAILALCKLQPAGPVGSGAEPIANLTTPGVATATPATAALER